MSSALGSSSGLHIGMTTVPARSTSSSRNGVSMVRPWDVLARIGRLDGGAHQQLVPGVDQLAAVEAEHLAGDAQLERADPVGDDRGHDVGATGGGGTGDSGHVRSMAAIMRT